MIDHFTVSVADMAASKAFYVKVLAPLGYSVQMDFGKMVGFGDHKPWLWLKEATPVTTPQHIAFMAKSRAAVDAFHTAALEAGAHDDGPPGVRHQYHPNYYGAFVVDPVNGHPIEAVCHATAVTKSGAAKRAKKSAKTKSAKRSTKKTRR